MEVLRGLEVGTLIVSHEDSPKAKILAKKGVAQSGFFCFFCFLKSKIKVASPVPFFVPNISDHKKLGLFLDFQYILSYRQESARKH